MTTRNLKSKITVALHNDVSKNTNSGAVNTKNTSEAPTLLNLRQHAWCLGPTLTCDYIQLCNFLKSLPLQRVSVMISVSAYVSAT